MDYQLVLQFDAPSEEQHERLTLLEDDFVEHLEDSAEVDGHEAGDAAFHIFITTGSPARTFDRLKPLLTERSLIDLVTVAYRHVDEDDYTILWPKEPIRPFLLP
jgi:hypothetical protein